VSRENIFHGNGYRRRFSCRMDHRTVLQRRRAIVLGDPAWLSATDAEHARLAVEANRTQHSCGLWRPSPEGPSGCAREPALAGPDTHTFPVSPPFKEATGSLPKGSVPLRFGWRLVRIVRAIAPVLFGGAAVGVGRTWGWPLAKPVTLRQRYAEPVGPPDVTIHEWVLG
jgi:hypothetical protein